MRTTPVVPTCATFTAAALRCTRCGHEMRIATAEPHIKSRELELRTYRCGGCDADESYLIRL